MIAINKLGTIDLDIVECNPIVFKGRLYLMEYIRAAGPHGPSHSYYGNTTGKPYCRFRDMTTGQSFSPPFGIDWCFGCAFVENDHIAVTVTKHWGANGHYIIESDDMINWSEPRLVFASPDHGCYNSSMCKAGNKYVNALEFAKHELSPSGDLQCEMFFVESTDLVNWQPASTKVQIEGAPMLRFHDDWYFYFHIGGSYKDGFTNRVARSRDLKTWESAPAPVLKFDDDDRKIHPLSNLTSQQLEAVKSSADINVSGLEPPCDI